MILLIEDNRDDEALTLRVLRKNKIVDTVVVARTGEEALEFLFGAPHVSGTDSAIGPRLILLDINLPVIGGHEVLRRIRADERTKLLPVVILTSSNEEKDVIASYMLGANSYLCKPVGLAEFAEVVRILGHFWLLLNIVSPRPTMSRRIV
jgi:two-component system, response regulator